MPIFYFVPDREADTFKMPLTAERLLRSLGTTGKLAGFRCTVYMVERIQEDPEQLHLRTPPTNSEFLDMLASYLREMGG